MEPLDLLEKVRQRKFTLGVIGLGRVGLPLALAFDQLRLALLLA